MSHMATLLSMVHFVFGDFQVATIGNSPFGTPTSMRFLHDQRANDYISQMEHDEGQGCHDDKAIS